MVIASTEARPPPPAAAPSPPRPRAGATGPPAEASPFAKLLRSIGAEMNRGEALVRAAMSGGAGLDAGGLLALQAGVYRYSESVDLAAKLVDRASNGVRTVVQGQ